jgi:hypothetical protein
VKTKMVLKIKDVLTEVPEDKKILVADQVLAVYFIRDTANQLVMVTHNPVTAREWIFKKIAHNRERNPDNSDAWIYAKDFDTRYLGFDVQVEMGDWFKLNRGGN